MDRFESMRIFVAVADAQGFAAAARQLRLSAPMVTRAIAALEAHIGATLLHRTTRRPLGSSRPTPMNRSSWRTGRRRVCG